MLRLLDCARSDNYLVLVFIWLHVEKFKSKNNSNVKETEDEVI
jgi:hypothetical protein